MADQQSISEQQELLGRYRDTLRHHLSDKARLTGGPIPRVTSDGIEECRKEIRRIKQVLREWGVQVDDHPNDEAPPVQPPELEPPVKDQVPPSIPPVSVAPKDPIPPSWIRDLIGRVIKKIGLVRSIAIVTIVLAAIATIIFLRLASDKTPPDPTPHFDIAALKTLSSDAQAYEVTGLLPEYPSELAKAGFDITFTLEVRPRSTVNQQFGRVVAIISGSGGDEIPPKLLWQNFSRDSTTQEIKLTPQELLQATGLRKNSPASHVFYTDERPFQQAKLIIKIAQEADLEHPWQTQEITIRNEPWELRSDVVERNGQYQAHVYVKNLGGPGEFKVTYRLARLDKDIAESELPIFSGTTEEEFSVQPNSFKQLGTNEVFTDTHILPSNLKTGRYLLEVIPVKRQNYVQFKDDSINWETIVPYQSYGWWWFTGPSQRTLFLVHPKFNIVPEIQAEVDRLKNNNIYDLGLPIEAASEVKSTKSTGWREVFQYGEVYVNDGKAFAIYGPILQRYKQSNGLQNDALGFPTSIIQEVTSVSGAKGRMMSFEGSAWIYETERGIAVTQGWIGDFFSQQGGPQGRLGFPLSDEQSRDGGWLQMYENGYIVCCKPKSYPYVEPNSKVESILFDVSAKESWQDTGIEVKPGDRITIVQTSGSWTNNASNQAPFDADGNQSTGNQQAEPSPEISSGTLIAKIGDADEHNISIGRAKSFLAATEGKLFLGMYDSNHDDNDGVISVQIFIERSK